MMKYVLGRQYKDRKPAHQTLADRTRFELSDEHWRAFQAALDGSRQGRACQAVVSPLGV